MRATCCRLQANLGEAAGTTPAFPCCQCCNVSLVRALVSTRWWPLQERERIGAVSGEG